MTDKMNVTDVKDPQQQIVNFDLSCDLDKMSPFCVVIRDSEEPAEASKQPLSDQEKADLQKYEGRIQAGIHTFQSTLNALAKIKAGKLYREQYGTFEEYCEKKWKMTRVHINRKLKAANCIENLKSEPIGSVAIPANEAQAREIADLPLEKQKKVAAEVNKTSGDKATAEDWKKARGKHAPRVSKTEKKVKPAEDAKAKVVSLPETQDISKRMAVLSDVLLELKNMCKEKAAHQKMLPIIERAIELNDDRETQAEKKEAA